MYRRDTIHLVCLLKRASDRVIENNDHLLWSIRGPNCPLRYHTRLSLSIGAVVVGVIILKDFLMAGNEWNTVSHKHKRDTRSEDDDAGDTVVYSPFKKKQANEHRAAKKFVLILVGIPGSGKSHVACKLEKVRVTNVSHYI